MMQSRITSRLSSGLPWDVCVLILVGASSLALAAFAARHIGSTGFWFDESVQFWMSLGEHPFAPPFSRPGRFVDAIWSNGQHNLDPGGFTVLLRWWIRAGAAPSWQRMDARLALPSVQARLIMAVAHAQLTNHAYLYGEAPLRELLDFVQLCRKHAHEINWTQLIGRFKTWNAQTALACHVLAGHELLGIPIPSEFRVNSIARVLQWLAMWQIDHPQFASARTNLLRPGLQARRSMSSAALRRQLRQNIRDPVWLSRQWRLLSGRRPG